MPECSKNAASELSELKADLQELLREAEDVQNSDGERRKLHFCSFVAGFLGSMLQSANAEPSQPTAKSREEREHKSIVRP